MAYWNSRGLRGSTLEEFVNLTNQEYLKHGLAVVQKLPTAIKPIQIDQEKRVIRLAYFEQKSTVDYMGNIQGIPVCFDVKETGKKSLPISNIHPHQVEFMDQFTRQSGLAFIIVQFTAVDRCYLLPFEEIKRYWDEAKAGGRKSIPCNVMKEEYEIRREGLFYLHYLRAVEAYLKDCSEEKENME